MILDATAGNRTMWEWKTCPHIIYLDKCDRLEIPAQILGDIEHTNFADGQFDTIFYDPPHTWGGGIHYFSFANAKERAKVWPNIKGTPTYYGWDCYKTKDALIAHIHRAQLELRRILKDDGLLWFKWNEMSIPLNRVLVIFNQWIVLMKLFVNDPTHTAGGKQTFWICMCKEKGEYIQRTLT